MRDLYLYARGWRKKRSGHGSEKKRDEKLGGNKSVRAYERQKGEDRERERERERRGWHTSSFAEVPSPEGNKSRLHPDFKA